MYYLRTQYNIALDRLKVLNDRLDSTALNALLTEQIKCSIEKLSELSLTNENELARMQDPCYDAYKKCMKRSSRNFGICTGGVILGGLFGSFFTFGGSLAAALAAQEACILNHAFADEDCKEDYTDCKK
jgi:hypothetical protein